MATKGNSGRGSRGACGGSRRQNGSGQRKNNIGITRKPERKRK